MDEKIQKKDGDVGAVVGSIIIIIIIVAGAFYLYGSVQERRVAPAVIEEADMMSEEEYEILSIEAIETELETMDTAEFDAQIQADMEAIDSAL